ncbi:MAG TPA: transcription antitermination factor NusB [Ferruginibacter sp.]|nr:transcription antitermination factor NusB [Ferruginibacter sp.]
MISRRNIRVKVMQTLYTMDSINNEINPVEAVALLKKQFGQSRRLLVYLIYFLSEVARYAEKDAVKKASKHLPSAEDLSINTKIAGNELLWKVLEGASFKEAIDELKPQHIIDNELLKKTYLALAQSEEYQDYITIQSRDKKGEKNILEFIFTNLMLPNEDFISHVEELFINWDDDAEMMSVLVLSFLQKPAAYNFEHILSTEKWLFAKDLLETVINKKEVSLELLKPKLKNWDADRIATLDLIIIQMGICEFLFFETIPTKVTINEYIDLAKDYSTPQSGQFINGILDNIHKELTTQNKIHKKSFKNSTL